MLDKAMLLFWNKGCNGTSPQEILDELGLSRSSLYDTFGDKRTLFIRALKRYRELVTSFVVNELDNAENIPAAIRTIFSRARETGLNSEKKSGCFMVNTMTELAPHDEEISLITQENRQALEDAFARAIKRGQDNKQLATTHTPRAAARFMLSTLWGITAHTKLETDKKMYDDTIRLAMSVIEK